MAEIVLDQVSKRYADGTLALREASFTIRDGEFFILVGPSGCGKSTLLNMIVGLEAITGGEIRVGGRRMNEIDPKDRNMAMVFQSYALYPHMTVRQNMAFPLELAKLPRAEIHRRVEEAAAILELGELLDRRPARLSGGQRQRVAMGRAIVRRPEVFLLDEPLSNLDARLRVQMRSEIARLQKRLGITTVYVTHDQTEAMTLGDRAAVLHRGEVQQIGTPRELYETPQNLFIAGFIGSPAMTFLPAEICDGRLLLPSGSIELPDGLPAGLPLNQPLIAGIRPEHFQLASPSTRGPRLRGPIEMVEWLGADLYVHVGLPGLIRPDWQPPQTEPATQNKGVALVARLDPAARLRAGDEIELGFDAHQLRLFDQNTGRCVSPLCKRWPEQVQDVGNTG